MQIERPYICDYVLAIAMSVLSVTVSDIFTVEMTVTVCKIITYSYVLMCCKAVIHSVYQQFDTELHTKINSNRYIV